MFNSLRYINRHLSRAQFKNVVYAHYISRLTYGSIIWNNLITLKEKTKLGVNLNRVLRLLCRDFAGALSNSDLIKRSSVPLIASLCSVADCTMLHKLCTELSVEPLGVRLLSQCSTSQRFPKKLRFYDYSCTKLGKNSFVNRAKQICEKIPFDWADLSAPIFKSKIRAALPT